METYPLASKGSHSIMLPSTSLSRTCASNRTQKTFLSKAWYSSHSLSRMFLGQWLGVLLGRRVTFTLKHGIQSYSSLRPKIHDLSIQRLVDVSRYLAEHLISLASCGILGASLTFQIFASFFSCLFSINRSRVLLIFCNGQNEKRLSLKLGKIA